MKTINKALEQYIQENIFPKYQSFDLGHNIDHVEKVIAGSIEIAKDYDVDINMVYTIASYHDIGLVQGRQNHQITSGILLQEDQELPHYFSKEQLVVMKEAIEDHRASNDYPPRTIYGKIVSEADRLLDCQELLYRTIQYGIKAYPEYTFEEQFERTYQHILEKYGENGYLKLWLNTKKNNELLIKIREMLKTKNKMKELCFKMYPKQ